MPTWQPAANAHTDLTTVLRGRRVHSAYTTAEVLSLLSRTQFTLGGQAPDHTLLHSFASLPLLHSRKEPVLEAQQPRGS